MRITFLFILLMLFFGCKKTVNTKPFQPRFVVEGWIENGDYPVVKLTHNLPVDAVIDSAQLEEVVIRWAKIEVHTDDESEILTLVRDDDIFPHYIYKGTQIKGKGGKHYRLVITYAGNIITAETTVPEVPSIDSVWFTGIADDEFQLNITFKDNGDTKDYYRFFSKQDSAKLFSTTTPGGFSDQSFNGKRVSFQLFRNRYSNVSKYANAYYFRGDTVNVKLSKMDSASFAYWQTIDREISSIPFLSKGTLNSSNISEPATGIWYGLASNVYTSSIK